MTDAMPETVHVPQHWGKLVSGAPGCDLHALPQCGARTRSGHPCRHPGTKANGRCRRHGGRSTGARTPEGLAKLRQLRSPGRIKLASLESLRDGVLALNSEDNSGEAATRLLAVLQAVGP